MKLSEKAKVKSSKSTTPKVDEIVKEVKKEEKYEGAVVGLWDDSLTSKRVKNKELNAENLPETTEYPLIKSKPLKAEIMLPSRETVDEYLQMYNYVKKAIVDRTDFITIQGRKFMKKSGWRKFIKPFNLSIQLIDKKVFELDGDVHAEARVRVSLPNGQYVEGYAIKSKSEYYSERFKNYGNYNLHNLVSTAITRATNRGISDLVGYGEVSAEEMVQRNDDVDLF